MNLGHTILKSRNELSNNVITSKQIICLSEEYVALGIMFGKATPIYKNPSRSDFLEILRAAREEKHKVEEIRFVADTNSKTVYVADGYNIGHPEILKAVGLPSNRFANPQIQLGSASLNNGKATVWSTRMESDYFYNKVKGDVELMNYYKKTYNYDWSWVDKYVSGFSNELKKGKDLFLKLK
jgi:hypothetical protein